MSHDTYVLPDGRLIRIIGDNILIRFDEPKDVSASGLIIFPQGSIEDVNNTGTILAFGTLSFGNGKRVPIPDLEMGMKCLFVRFLAEQDSNKQLRIRLGHNIIRLKPSDILFLYDARDDDKLR